MTAIGAAVLASMAAWIEGQISDEHASRQVICEAVAAQLRDMAAALCESGEDGTEPYCTTCGQWAGLFLGLDGWHHFRGDPAPGGKRELYDAGHEPVIGWMVPPGASLAPADVATVLDALDVAADYKRDRAAACPDCEAHPAGLCDTCAWRLQQAEAYDRAAGHLRGTR